MATLNLGSFKTTSKNSIIGYNSTKDAFSFASVAGGLGTGFNQVTSISVSGNTYTLDMSSFTTALAGIQDATANRNWNITAPGATSKIQLTGGGDDTVTFSDKATSKLDINTGAGNDVINLSSAVDAVTITAGAGNDAVNVGTAKDSLKIDLGAGKDSVTVGAAYNKLTISSTGSDAKSVVVTSLAKGATVDITLAAGDDTLTFGNTAVSGKIALGAGKDFLVVGGSLEGATVTSGNGDKNINVTGTTKESSITTGNGNDSINLVGGLENSSISSGDGKDKVTVAGAASGLVNLGAGDDTIDVKGVTSADGFTITGGAGKDTIDLTGANYSGTITLSDAGYDDVVVLGASLTGAELKEDGTVETTGHKFKVASTTGGAYALRYNDGTTTHLVGWGGDNATMVNASGATESVILYGNANGDVVDTLVGGTKSDTLVLGEGDYADGGKGNDVLQIAATGDTQEYVGITTGGGKDSVTGFQAITSSTEGDVVYLYQNNIASGKLTTNGNNLVVKVDNASIQLDVDASTDVAINVKDSTGKVQTVDYVSTTASVSDTDSMQDIYYAGNKSAAIDFTNTDETLVVDLNNRKLNFNNTSLANSSNTTYYGSFASVTGGSDTTVLLGSATDKNTLVAGTGETSLWGGGAKADLLVGNSSTDNTVTYYYGNGDGKDTIQGANWGSDDNADVLYLGSASELVVKNDGTNTTVKVGDSDKLTVAGFAATDTAVKFTTDGTNVYEAKVGQSGQANTWTYEEDVWAYIGGTNNTLNVGSNVDGTEIWLDGSKGKNFSSISTVDASANNNSVGVAGTSGNEVLVGGTGSTSLWGGAGNDSLQGTGMGETTFFFGKGDGSDVITGSGSDDKVVLYNVALSDFAGVDTETSGQLKATLTDGSTLTVQNVSSSSVSTFTLSDGSTFVYDSSSKTFSQTK